jgi:afadin
MGPLFPFIIFLFFHQIFFISLKGGTLKIYGESLCRDVPYKTLLLSIRDCAQAVVREMLTKYGMDKADPLHYCLVQVSEFLLQYFLWFQKCKAL